jgi:hypothetical protein
MGMLAGVLCLNVLLPGCGGDNQGGPVLRIYVSDNGNNRIVRMDDMTGAGWTAFGSVGSGTDQFNSPAGIALR